MTPQLILPKSEHNCVTMAFVTKAFLYMFMYSSYTLFLLALCFMLLFYYSIASTENTIYIRHKLFILLRDKITDKASSILQEARDTRKVTMVQILRTNGSHIHI